MTPDESVNTFGLYLDAYAALKSAEQVAVQNATNFIGCVVTPVVVNNGAMLYTLGTWDLGCSVYSSPTGLVTAEHFNTPISKNSATPGFSEETIDKFNATCDTPQQYTIKLSNDASLPASGDLAEIEPGKVTTTLRAKVYDSNNQPVPNVNIKLEVTVEASSGGHLHDNSRPRGLLSNGAQAGTEITGNTGGDGIPFTFSAPAPAGDHKIKATCLDRDCTQEGPDKVWVGVKGLQSIGSGPWELVGQDDAHPNNHYLAPAAYARLARLAHLYHLQFPSDPALRLNDASLVRGGLFDITYPARTAFWTPPHQTHRLGTEIDMRANEFVNPDAIPHRNYFDFEDIAIDVGCSAGMHSEFTRNQHYHITCR